MNINSFPSDLRKQLFYVCDEPAATSSVCKLWYKETQELINNIAIGATQEFMTRGLTSLIRRYTASLPEFVKEDSRKTALVFRRIVLRQQNEFQHLFSKFHQVPMKYPNIPSVAEFIQTEKAIETMNEISFSYHTLLQIITQMADGSELSNALLEFAVEPIKFYSSTMEKISSMSSEEFYDTLSILEEFDRTAVRDILISPQIAALFHEWKNSYGRKNLYPLTRVSADVGKLKNLRGFGASFEGIRFLPDEFRKLTKLRVLCLNSNQLSEEPAEIREIQTLAHKCFKNNPFHRKKEFIYDRIWDEFFSRNQLLVAEIIPFAKASKQLLLFGVLTYIALYIYNQHI